MPPWQHRGRANGIGPWLRVITKGSRWIRNEQGIKINWVVGGYFDPTRWVERFRFTDAPAEAPEFGVPRFDRTLSELRQHAHRGGIRSAADRGAAPLGRVLPGPSRPAWLA